MKRKPMEVRPAIGWTLLSREAIKKAQDQLDCDDDGVRDELGVLALHQGFADVLFPGTSVLHTRLRYVLFVPWLFQALATAGGGDTPVTRLREAERILAKRLKNAGEAGIIGGRNTDKHSAQPPSMVYWTCLGAWGLLKPRTDSSLPSRAEALRLLRHRGRNNGIADDDRQRLESIHPLFVDTPAAPPTWSEAHGRLDFTLSAEERRFLRTRMSAVLREDGEASLLARLVQARLPVAQIAQPWAAPVHRAADRWERQRLERAHSAACMAALARAVYAALVEETRERADGIPTGDLHRRHLDQVLERYRGVACRVPAEDLNDPALDLPHSLIELLRRTQEWAHRGRRPSAILDLYASAEAARKGARAKLGALRCNAERRREWQPEQHSLARPLHYRWANVQRLLNDLGSPA
jgi:hypothetical protein